MQLPQWAAEATGTLHILQLAQPFEGRHLVSLVWLKMVT